MHPPPDPRRNESRYPSRWVAAHQRTVIGAALLLTLLALPFAAGLHIESDLVSLLPEGSPAADDYRTFLDRFGGFEKVFVMVLADPDPGSPPSGLLLETAQELAARLRTLPGVARVRTGSEPEDEAFFVHHVVRRAPLLLPDDALPAIAERLRPEAIRERAATLRARLRTPSGSAMAELLTHDPLGFAEDLPLLAAGQHLPVDPVTSAFLSPAGDAALLILDPASGEMDAEAGRQLLADLQRTFEELHRDLTTPRTEDAEDAWHLTDDGSEGTRHQAEDRVVGAAEGAWHRGDDAGGGGTEGAWHQSERHQSESAAEGAWHRVRSERIEPGAGLRFLALGGPLYAAQDEAMLRRDLKLTISGSALGCTALLLAAFGGAGIPLAALAVLAVALVWTGALLALGLGSVTAVSFGFAAVLVGLGLDYAIHGSTAYRRERFRGRPPAEALRATFHFAGPGITTSALTTSAAFATLGAAHFRPLRELGTVTAAGILTILLATATLGAALLTRLGHGKPGRLWSALAAAVASATRLGTRHPRAVLVATALLTAAALAGARQLHLDPDLRALRPAHHPVFEAEALLVDRFAVGLDTSTVVVRGEELDHALEAAGRIATSIRRTVPEVSVISPTDWIVPEPARRERLRALSPLGFGGAADLLEAELLTQGLAPRAFASGLEALRSLARGEDPGPTEPADWPSGLAELVRLGDPGTETGSAAGRGRAAAWVALRLRTPDGLWPEGPPTELRRLLEQQDPGVAIASVPRLGREMKALAVRDLESLAWIALSLVAMAVGVSFRGHLLSALLAMLPVLLGSLWALGLWGALGGRLDLLSLAVIPILLGIGIDDGLHAVHGARAGEGNLGEAVREAGLAMSLTTLTTCLGFGSLVLSSIPGLERGGLVVSLGVALCLAATLLVLPALGRLLPPLPTSAELARKIHETSS